MIEHLKAFAIDTVLVLCADQRRVNARQVVVEADVGVSAGATVICEVQLRACVGEAAGQHILNASAGSVPLGAPDRPDGVGELLPHA